VEIYQQKCGKNWTGSSLEPISGPPKLQIPEGMAIENCRGEL
jgi:hypothetical protein